MMKKSIKKQVMGMVLGTSVLLNMTAAFAESEQTSAYGVKVFGTIAAKKTPYVITVYAPDFEISDMVENEPLENAKKVVFINEGITDNEGGFSESLEIGGKTGLYRVKINSAKTGESLVEDEFIDFVNIEEFSEVTKALKSASDDEFISIIEENNHILKFDKSTFLCNEEKAAKILKNNSELETLENDDISGWRNAYLTASFIQSLNEGKISNIFDYSEHWEEIIPEILEYKEEDLLLYEEENREDFTDRLSSKNISDNSELKKVMAEEFLLMMILEFDGADTLRQAFEDFYAITEIDLDSYKDVNITRVCGEEYESLEAFIEAIEDKSSQKTESSSGKGSSSSGGGKSTVGSTLIAGSEKAQSTEVEELPLDVYTDLDSTLWARNAIVWLTDRGIVSGKSKDKFAPADAILREEFVKILVNSFAADTEPAALSFTDVKKDGWYYSFVAKAVNAGIANGYSDTHFGIGDNITRQDLAVMLYRAAYSNTNTEEIVLDFTDAEQISDYAKEAVFVLSSKGVINGLPDGSFNPKANATRAEAAKMVYEVLK